MVGWTIYPNDPKGVGTVLGRMSDAKVMVLSIDCIGISSIIQVWILCDSIISHSIF